MHFSPNLFCPFLFQNMVSSMIAQRIHQKFCFWTTSVFIQCPSNFEVSLSLQPRAFYLYPLFPGRLANKKWPVMLPRGLVSSVILLIVIQAPWVIYTLRHYRFPLFRIADRIETNDSFYTYISVALDQSTKTKNSLEILPWFASSKVSSS